VDANPTKSQDSTPVSIGILGKKNWDGLDNLSIDLDNYQQPSRRDQWTCHPSCLGHSNFFFG